MIKLNLNPALVCPLIGPTLAQAAIYRQVNGLDVLIFKAIDAAHKPLVISALTGGLVFKSRSKSFQLQTTLDFSTSTETVRVRLAL
ncbi:MAG: hypothetical protein AUG51_02585 [Acidobacteria bacterium 13_1_20CM_3_53_8]|nr:MAG: hypothetical protein AUG51_02585 [Acidobacteria bacterium 13_1_20CM_3_53_8]